MKTFTNGLILLLCFTALLSLLSTASTTLEVKTHAYDYGIYKVYIAQKVNSCNGWTTKEALGVEFGETLPGGFRELLVTNITKAETWMKKGQKPFIYHNGEFYKTTFILVTPDLPKNQT